MKRLISFFECGRNALRSSKDYGDFLVTTFQPPEPWRRQAQIFMIKLYRLPKGSERSLFRGGKRGFQKYEIKGAKGDDFGGFL